MSESITTLKANFAKGSTFFTWGKLINIHSIGEYDIVEFHPSKIVNGFLSRHETEDAIHFRVFVANKDTNSSYFTLDEAIAGAIAFKYEGPNHKANHYFIKSIS